MNDQPEPSVEKIKVTLSVYETFSRMLVLVKKKLKVDDRFQEVEIKQPQVIHDYNKFMNGVDRSDQLIAQTMFYEKQ